MFGSKTPLSTCSGNYSSISTNPASDCLEPESSHLKKEKKKKELKATPQSVTGCGAAAGDACGKDRTGPILCDMQLCCSQSQLGQQPERTSDKMADPAELSDSKMARRIDLY